MNTQKVIECWNKLSECLSCIDWTDYAGLMLKLALEESKSHDSFRGADIQRGISIETEAKYVLVKRVYQYTTNKDAIAPDAAYFFSMQKSCFACYAIAKNKRFQAAVKKWLQESESLIATVASYDYCALITVKEHATQYKKEQHNEKVYS